MRELKFRTYEQELLDKSEMIYFEFNDFDGYLFIPTGRYYGDFEIMQYTGLKDKNDKEVYDGDICIAYDGIIYWIEWNVDLFTYVLRNPENDDFEPICDYDSDDLEVIGNKHENHELLRGTE